MRIGIVVEHLDPVRGGAERWTFQFVDWLLRHGHGVDLIARSCASDRGRLGEARLHRITTGRSRLAFGHEAQRVAASLDVDIVHDMGYGWYCDVFQPHGGSRIAAFQQNLLIEPGWKRPWKRAAQRILPRYREFDQLLARQYGSPACRYLAVSDMVSLQLRRLHDVPESRIRRIYNGVDCVHYSPAQETRFREPIRRQLRVEQESLLMLLVAHNLKLKGLPTLLRALARLRSNGYAVNLAVVGGKRLARFQELARRMGVAKHVSWLGCQLDAGPYFAAADVYVHPTMYDPCSLVVLEALASGLPVVTSRFNGVAELISDGVEGRVIHDPGDASELVAAIEPTLSPITRREMGRAARSLAERHTLTDNFQRITEWYGDLLQQKRRAA